MKMVFLFTILMETQNWHSQGIPKFFQTSYFCVKSKVVIVLLEILFNVFIFGGNQTWQVEEGLLVLQFFTIL